MTGGLNPIARKTPSCPQVPPDVWAAEEQDMLLLLLEPEEFVRGVAQITQVLGPLPLRGFRTRGQG